MNDILIKSYIKDWYTMPMFSLKTFSYESDGFNGQPSSYDTLYVIRIPTGWLVHQYSQPDCFVPYNEIDINYEKKE